MRIILAAGAALLLSLLVTPNAAVAQKWGDLTVRFTYDGAVPSPAKLQITKDPEVCGKHGLVDESLVVNKENKGIQHVVGYLLVGRGDKQPPMHPSYEETATATVQLDNNQCRFEPRLQILRTTQTLEVLNSDPVGHNTKIDPAIANPGQNVLVPAGGKITMNFGNEERIPAPVSCSIHPWMKAHLLIRSNPYAAVSDKDGKLTIKNLPAGEWTFQFWHEKSGYVAEGKRDGKAVKWRRGRVDLDITESGVDLGEIKLAEIFK